MNTIKFNISGLLILFVLISACKKEEATRETLADGRVSFNLPQTTEVVTNTLNIKEVSLISLEMKASLEGSVSSDTHYITFATDTTKIIDYRAKYGNAALLLPTRSYLYYKSTVALAPGNNTSEAAILNLSYQTDLKANSTYVLPLVIASIDGKKQDPKTRRVVYYVFKTGEALYVDHSGFTLTATASSTSGTNTASRAIDAATGTTYWASATTVSLPQWVSIDFGRSTNFSGLDYFFPTAVTSTVGGYTTSAKIETSLNGTTWTDNGTYTVNIDNPLKKQTIALPSLTTARYLRFTILSATPYKSGTLTYSIGFVGGILLRN
ncbi:discoidin domain-containing protein [Pedobacter sp. MW01-1-1]|uniref:discoidin domain-containing protein n=1 Tax=Pedobacter sp. MW01-1-1 TaxID=3383027 RepID=UPI003FEDE277